MDNRFEIRFKWNGVEYRSYVPLGDKKVSDEEWQDIVDIMMAAVYDVYLRSNDIPSDAQGKISPADGEKINTLMQSIFVNG